MNTDHAIRVKLINLLYRHGQLVDKELDIGEKIDEMVERIVSERDTAIRERDAAKAEADRLRSYLYVARRRAVKALAYPDGHVCDFRAACQSFADITAKAPLAALAAKTTEGGV